MPAKSFRKPMKNSSLGRLSQKTHKTALVIIPPKEFYPPIQRIRKKYDRHYHRWMPHINLLYPFKPKSEFSRSLDLIWMICEKTQSFEVHLEKFCYFSHGKGQHTLWLSPEPSEKLRVFQNSLRVLFPECGELNRFGAGFTPHLSVGQVKGRDKTQMLQKDLETSWKRLQFQVDRVHLIWRRDPPNDRFQIGETIRLGR